MPNIATAKLMSKGQVTLPVEVRLLLEVDNGDKIQFEFDSDSKKVIIRKPVSPNGLEQLFAGWNLEDPRAAADAKQLMEEGLEDDGPIGGEYL